MIEATDSPSNVANAVAVSPLGPVGASTVTVGVDVYPVPPDPTEIVCTDSNSSQRMQSVHHMDVLSLYQHS